MAASIYLGTVAIEPTRFERGPEQPARIPLSRWLDDLAAAGFDGLEIFERHLTEADGAEVERVLGHRLPVRVWNSYVSLDEVDPEDRRRVADWVRRTDAEGVKFDVGRDEAAEPAYVERIAAWLDDLPDATTLLCECHHGRSIAEVPATAARIFESVGQPERLGAIVHTHESTEYISERFEAYGDRIRHVHVNFLDFGGDLHAPRLADVADDLIAKVDLLKSLGFDGTWTIEFVRGLRTEHDRPDVLVPQAIEDLELLRSIL